MRPVCKDCRGGGFNEYRKDKPGVNSNAHLLAHNETNSHIFIRWEILEQRARLNLSVWPQV